MSAARLSVRSDRVQQTSLGSGQLTWEFAIQKVDGWAIRAAVMAQTPFLIVRERFKGIS